MPAPDPEKVREFMILEGLRTAGSDESITPPEVRYFEKYYPSYVRREAEEAARERERKERDREARESARQYEEQRQRMADMRRWGPENGFFVGTRGRIPRKVIDAYNKAKGISQ